MEDNIICYIKQKEPDTWYEVRGNNVSVNRLMFPPYSLVNYIMLSSIMVNVYIRKDLLLDISSKKHYKSIESGIIYSSLYSANNNHFLLSLDKSDVKIANHIDDGYELCHLKKNINLINNI